jgi:predicted lipoprotein with Yx(FWY)xxD motif
VNRSNSVWWAQVALALATACGGSNDGMSQPPPSGSSVKLVATATLGNILVDGSGRTLYYFSQDLPAGGGKSATSNCTGSASDGNSCVHFWPIFYAANPTVGTGLNAADFGQMVRAADGMPQTTYKGFPLYYFLGDANPGDVHGESIEDWFVIRAPFYNVMTLDGGTDRLTDGAGRTLYTFLADTVGTPPVSACEGTAGDRNTCVGNWPIFYAGTAIVAPTGLDPARFSTFTRADNQKQTAFDGQPLYYFVDDASPGDVKGLTFPPGLGFWFTADPAQR